MPSHVVWVVEDILTQKNKRVHVSCKKYFGLLDGEKVPGMVLELAHSSTEKYEVVDKLLNI